jgi:hypothetical protein
MKTDPCAVSHDDKNRMIANAAYFRAARRGFGKTDPLDDWLAAEAEIEAFLQTGCIKSPAEPKPPVRGQTGLIGAVSDWWHRRMPRAVQGGHRLRH